MGVPTWISHGLQIPNKIEAPMSKAVNKFPPEVYAHALRMLLNDEEEARPIACNVAARGDNAFAETSNGLEKTGVIHQHEPWRGFDGVEIATMAWMDGLNNKSLWTPIGDIMPARAGELCYASPDQTAMSAQLKKKTPASPGRFTIDFTGADSGN